MDSDLFFCTKLECHVITFRPGPGGRNVCPKCFEPGSIVRYASSLAMTAALDAGKKKGESE